MGLWHTCWKGPGPFIGNIFSLNNISMRWMLVPEMWRIIMNKNALSKTTNSMNKRQRDWDTLNNKKQQQTNQCKQAALFVINFLLAVFFAFQLPLYTSAFFFLPCFSHRRPNKNSRAREPFSPGAILDMPLHLAKDRTNCMEHGGITTSVSPTPPSLHWSISLLTGVRLPFITMQFTNTDDIEIIYNVGELF